MKYLSLIAIVVLLSGCETYKNSKLTPSGFNYTLATDHPRDGEGMRPAQHYFGLSWDLK